MKTRVIPAQVTTVEDKIAGNLNFVQILLFVSAVLAGTGIFVLLPKPMALEIYKLVLILLAFMFFGVLAIRIRDRVILNWVVLLASYALRPRIFVFDKNSAFARTVEVEGKERKPVRRSKNITEVSSISIEKDSLDYISAVRSTDFDISFSARKIKVSKSI